MDASFFVGYVITGVGLGFLAHLIWPWASTSRGSYVLLKKTRCILGAFDGFSTVCG